MSFVRRLLGARQGQPSGEHAEVVPAGQPEPSEEERDRAVLREEAARLDELQQRQLRYAEYAWQPEAQGGTRRAEDEDPDRAE